MRKVKFIDGLSAETYQALGPNYSNDTLYFIDSDPMYIQVYKGSKLLISQAVPSGVTLATIDVYVTGPGGFNKKLVSATGSAVPFGTTDPEFTATLRFDDDTTMQLTSTTTRYQLPNGYEWHFSSIIDAKLAFIKRSATRLGPTTMPVQEYVACHISTVNSAKYILTSLMSTIPVGFDCAVGSVFNDLIILDAVTAARPATVTMPIYVLQ